MERDSLKRGVELTNRLGESGVGKKIQATFSWWTGGKINKTTFLFLGFVFIVNIFLIYPLLTRDLTVSYSSSQALSFFGNFLESIGFIPKSYFFLFLTFTSLSIAPISFYLFVRRTVLRHEMTAFLATLLYVLPNPLTGNNLPLAQAIISGDGAHAFAFSFAPLVLLTSQVFIGTGLPFWGVVSAAGTGLVSFISPFALFNLLIFLIIVTVAEGFMGNFRTKFIRLVFLLASSFGLSFFWYYPNIIGKILDLSHVSYALNKSWSIFPLLVPSVPILGIIFFLILDRREKLKPIFISLSLFIIYLFLYGTSRNLAVSGIFTAERYLVEMSFVKAFFFSLIIVLIIESALRNYILKAKKLIFFPFTIVFYTLLTLFLIFSVQNALAERNELAYKAIVNNYNSGIGSLARGEGLAMPDLIAGAVSLFTLAFLLFVIKRSQSIGIIKKKEVI